MGHGPDSKWVNNIEALLKHNQEKINLSEGLAGTVINIEGNCMPMIVVEGEGENTCLRYPVRRVIHIHEYTCRNNSEHLQGGFHTNVETVLIAKVESDAEGFFQAELPPGKYSLFISEENMLYANLWDGQGGVQPVEVREGEVSVAILEISHSATF